MNDAFLNREAVKACSHGRQPMVNRNEIEAVITATAKICIQFINSCRRYHGLKIKSIYHGLTPMATYLHRFAVLKSITRTGMV